ncbi:YcxB family protein [Glaciecola sp. MH2013]|uniref:YcxB family protein n=1 Tax=Glaciecola sp. MH2013 TaxID=2785524 RepID=UPI00189C8804|nr:YcxB family protein [Glaciecola sp. MH2013]MBF7074274.1 YcxB family protein [Glaciecola sp. MH2013]
MTKAFQYSTTYTLNKSHYSETYDQTVVEKSPSKAYAKAIALFVVGSSIVYLTDEAAFFAWFIVVLGIVEALSVYFRRPWWLARQMISQAANTNLTLSIDEISIRSESQYVNSEIKWADITLIEQTPKGWLIHHSGMRSYISKQCLSDEANEFFSKKLGDI